MDDEFRIKFTKESLTPYCGCRKSQNTGRPNGEIGPNFQLPKLPNTNAPLDFSRKMYRSFSVKRKPPNASAPIFHLSLAASFTHLMSPAGHRHAKCTVPQCGTYAINTLIVNQNRPCAWTTLVALDFSKEFGIVNYSVLLRDIENYSLPPGLKRWTVDYLSSGLSTP